MQKPNPKLNRLIEQITRGDASPIPDGEEMGGERVWSGAIAEIDERTFCFYRDENAGPPKMMQDHWFLFSDVGTVATPGILFWQMKDQHFARRLDDEQWQDFLTAAKIKKTFW